LICLLFIGFSEFRNQHNLEFKKEKNMDYRKLINEQLGDGYTFVKVYNAFENGELRIIAKDTQGCEHRYILTDGKLTEKP
jgi:hypothetical protein